MIQSDPRDDGNVDTFPMLLLQHARKQGNRTAIREKDLGIWQSWTWAQVADEVRALACGLAALALTLAGRPLVGGTIHAIAAAAQGSQMLLTPLARLIGEPDFGPVTSAIIGTAEGVLFGAGLALGLTRRPKARAARNAALATVSG